MRYLMLTVMMVVLLTACEDKTEPKKLYIVGCNSMEYKDLEWRDFSIGADGTTIYKPVYMKFSPGVPCAAMRQ
jgi:hypothetical protein